eukprot:COSAG02_NODE_550_length_20437_cov_4.270676_9_plen_512_part_00
MQRIDIYDYAGCVHRCRNRDVGLQELATALGGVIGTALSPEPEFQPSELITPQLRREFVERGFIVVRGAVGEQLRDEAVQKIAQSLATAQEGEGSSLPVPKVLTSCPELTTTDTITHLLTKSSALGCVHALLGDKCHRPYFGQIALRPSGHGCLGALPAQVTAGRPLLAYAVDLAGNRTPVPRWEEHWHIDGWPSDFGRLLPKGHRLEVKNFSCLVGVVLSDCTERNMGNLTVYPDSHRIIESVLREMGGPEAIFTANSAVSDATLRSARRAGSVSAAIDEQVAATNELRRLVHPRIGHPEQVLARPGDVIIAHYQLAHCIAPNVSDVLRQCVYFRLTHRRRPPSSYCPEAMTNIWSEFAGCMSVDTFHAGASHTTAAGTVVPHVNSSRTVAVRRAQVEMEAGAHALEDGARLEALGRAEEALSLYETGIATLLGCIKTVIWSVEPNQQGDTDCSAVPMATRSGGSSGESTRGQSYVLSEPQRTQLREVISRHLAKAEAIKLRKGVKGAAD